MKDWKPSGKHAESDAGTPTATPGKRTLADALPADAGTVHRKASSTSMGEAGRAEPACGVMGLSSFTPPSSADAASPTAPQVAGTVQRSAAASNASSHDPAAALSHAKQDSGAPVDASLRQRFEAATGQDVGDVRVHSGAASDRAAVAVAAHAFTLGQDIHFGEGKYRPGTREGDHLIAHELAHTVQQRGMSGIAQTRLTISEPGDSAEREADAVADAVTNQTAASPITAAPQAVARAANAEASNHVEAEAQLAEAIQIVEAALDIAHSDMHAPAAAADTGATPPAQPSRFTPDQMAHLQQALTKLHELRGKSPDEIRAAALPIIQAARGESPQAPPAGPGGPVQRAAMALAPAVAAGPPGWVVLAVAVIVVGGIVIYEASRNRERARERERAEPRVAPRTGERPLHMGNIHVQGDDIRAGAEPNVPWSQPTPMTKAAALTGLATLQGLLSARQMSFRDVAFARAANFINSTLHTAPPPLFRTFQNPSVIDDERHGTRRVDIEIIRGQAFV